MENKDYYAILGVSRDADTATIKRAYRKLARRYHPDVSDEPDAEAKFKEIGEAWEVLGDEEKRAAYDAFQRGDHHHYQGQPGGGAEDVDLGEFFRNIFGAEMGAEAGGFGGFRGGFRSRGQDLHVRLPITLEESYQGGEQTVTLNVPQQDAQGRVLRQPKTLRVKIPKGVQEGQQIRLAGQGAPALGQGEPGDLYIEIQFVPHPEYAVDGRDLVRRVPLAPWEAVLGGEIQVPTLGGRVKVKVPAGTRSGSRLRLKGRGLPGQPPGDQYLEFEIVTPRNPTARERELYEELASASSFNPRAAEA